MQTKHTYSGHDITGISNFDLPRQGHDEQQREETAIKETKQKKKDFSLFLARHILFTSYAKLSANFFLSCFFFSFSFFSFFFQYGSRQGGEFKQQTRLSQNFPRFINGATVEFAFLTFTSTRGKNNAKKP